VLAAALAAAPARGDDTVGIVPSATTADSPVPAPVDTTAQSNTATNTQTATATGGAGGSATGGNTGPSQGSDGGSYGGDAYANGGSAQSQNSTQNGQSNQTSGRDSRGDGARWGGDDDYYGPGSTKPQHSRGAAHRAKRARSVEDRGHRAPNPGTRTETSGRSHHGTGGASSGGGPPGHGGPLPDQSPFLSLLNAPGSAGAGLMLLLLAVLGAAIALPNRHFRAFRMPAAQWRPLAYVPPIELPG
jgi:hypothetical protein